MTQSDIIQKVRVIPEGSQRTVTELGKVRTSLNDVEKAAKTAGAGVSTTMSGGGVNRLSTAQSAAGAAGGVLSTVGGSQVASITSSVLGLTSSLGAVGAVAGVAVAGFSLLQAEIEANKKAAEEAATAFAGLAGQIASGATSEDLQAGIDAKNREIQVLQETQDELLAYGTQLDALKQQYREGTINLYELAVAQQPINHALNEMTGGLIGAKDGVGVFVTSTSDLMDTINAGNDDISAAEQKVAFYSAALETNAVKANDAAAAAERLADAQVDAAQEALRIDRLTADQRAERIAQNDRDVNVLTRLIGAGGLSAAALQELADQITELNDDTTALKAVGESYADTLERQRIATENLTNRNEQILDLVNQEVKAQEEIYKIREDINAITSEAEAEAARIRGETQESLREVEAEAAEERIEIAEDTADRIEKIEREAGRSLETAKGERDAYGFKQAEERREDALTDEEKAQKKQIENLETSLRKQTDTALKAQQRQLSDLAASTTREINTKRSGLAYQENIVATSMTSQAFLAANGATKVVSEHAKMYTALEGAAYLAGTKIVQAFLIGAGQQPIGGVVGGGTGGGSGGGLGLGLQGAMERTVDARLKAYVNAGGA